jgi:hypothetical protein
MQSRSLTLAINLAGVSLLVEVTMKKYEKIGILNWDPNFFESLKPYIVQIEWVMTRKITWVEGYIDPGTVFTYTRKSGYGQLAIATYMKKRKKNLDYREVYRLNDEGSQILTGLLVESKF